VHFADRTPFHSEISHLYSCLLALVLQPPVRKIPRSVHDCVCQLVLLQKLDDDDDDDDDDDNDDDDDDRHPVVDIYGMQHLYSSFHWKESRLTANRLAAKYQLQRNTRL